MRRALKSRKSETTASLLRPKPSCATLCTSTPRDRCARPGLLQSDHARTRTPEKLSKRGRRGLPHDSKAALSTRYKQGKPMGSYAGLVSDAIARFARDNAFDDAVSTRDLARRYNPDMSTQGMGQVLKYQKREINAFLKK